MKVEEWREKYGDQNPTKQVLEKIITEVDATIVKRDIVFAKQTVSGKCLSEGCENTYEKTVPYLLKGVGPFCDFCKRYKEPLKETQQLIKDSCPDVYNSIVQCDVDKDLLTIGCTTMATYRCGEQCTRCETPHEWSSIIRKRIEPSKFGNCPYCSGNRSCPCMKEGDFRCYICKRIKQEVERSGSTTRCKLCSRSMNDGDVKKVIRYLWQRTHSIMQRDQHKCGDLTEQHLHEKYVNQQGLCHISGIRMGLGTFINWQMSVERIVEKGGTYNNDNVVLICREFQHGSRQFSKDVWDDMCSLILGVEEEDGEEIDRLIQQEMETPVYNLPVPPKPNHSTTKDGKRFCKYCNEWKEVEKMAYQKASKCKICRKKGRDWQKATFHGRFHYLFQTAKHGHRKRNLEFTITEQDIEQIYLKQHGRCLYSKIPLAFSGQYQMSLERVDPKKGYIPENIALIILGLNTTDYTRIQHEDDERNGSSGWNENKLMWAVQQNRRQIIPKSSSVLDILKKLRDDREKIIGLRR